MKNIYLYIQKAQWTPSGKISKKYKPRYIIIKFMKVKDKEKF